MNKLTLPVLTLMSAFALSAQAEPGDGPRPYIGAGVGNYSYDYSNIDNSNAWKAYGGVQFDNGLFLEGQYQDLGKAEVTNAPYELRFKGYSGFVGYRFGGDALSVFVKGGLYSLEGEERQTALNLTDTNQSSGPAVGLGLSFPLGETLALRGEVEGFIDVKDFSVNDRSSIWGGALSLEARF